MKKLITILFLFAFSLSYGQYIYKAPVRIVARQTPTVPTEGAMEYTFALDISSHVSAGVYDPSDVLVRSLFTDQSYTSGSHTEAWDGRNDNGDYASDGAYTIKVIASNMTYAYNGMIGNTTTNFSGFEVIQDVKVVGAIAYFCQAYNEQGSSTYYFATGTPQTKVSILGKGAECRYVCSDGITVWYAGRDPNNRYKNFVFAINHSNKLDKTFTSGTSYATIFGRTYPSAIDIVDNTPGSPVSTVTNFNTDAVQAEQSGIAVQTVGNFLFVARHNMNSLHVLNKTTGAVVQTLIYTDVRGIKVDNDDNLWMITGTNTVAKYTINGDGTLTSATLTLSGLVAPIALGFSPDNTTMVVNDAGASMQVKAFNVSTGASVWTKGTAGGYSTDASVSNDKFYFEDDYSIYNPEYKTFCAFQPDGTFWIGDPGNSRLQHYAADRTYIDRVMYLPSSYSCRVDKNAPTRVFSEYKEFAIDYSEPVAAQSWTLTKNWGAFFSSSNDNTLHRLRDVVTLSNGRTYALKIPLGATPTVEVIELTSANAVRFTGITWVQSGNDGIELYPDGSLRRITKKSIGITEKWYQKDLTGFDGSNNPTWGSETLRAQSAALSSTTNIGYGGDMTHVRAGEKTTSGKYVVLSAPGLDLGSHLGFVKASVAGWSALNAPSTFTNFIGDYPRNGGYDIGNGVINAGSSAVTLGNNVLWGYTGEFRKSAQANMFGHVWENGLTIGVFGWSPEDYGATGDAGNAFSFNTVYDPNNNDIAYIYQNDESRHGAVHRWKMTGLNSIAEQTSTVTKSGIPTAPTLDYINVLSLTQNATVPVGVTGNITRSTGWQSVASGRLSYDRNDVDLYFTHNLASGSATLSATLDPTGIYHGSLNTWELSADWSQDQNNLNHETLGFSGGIWYDVLDNAGKVISRFLARINTGSLGQVVANGAIVVSGDYTAITKGTFFHFKPIRIRYASGVLTYSYNGTQITLGSVFEAGADVLHPTTLRIEGYAAGAVTTRIGSIKKLRFTNQ